MKIIYLLPPSEGKNTGGELGTEKLSFNFSKPLEIAQNVTEKDLKCKGERYKQAVEFNALLCSPFLLKKEGIQEKVFCPAISRYSGVMYNAIDYEGMSDKGKRYFEKSFLILSGMYGMLSPLDAIENYKLPIETKGLYVFWGTQITDVLNTLQADYIVDMLPVSYAKMIRWNDISSKIIRVHFLKHETLPLEKGIPEREGVKLKKISHGVKKIKGDYIYNLCEEAINNIEDLRGEKVQISENEYHVQVISEK